VHRARAAFDAAWEQAARPKVTAWLTR
jgi:hypothetical protein